MKKIIIGLLGLAICANMVYAGQTKKIPENASFDTVPWSSNNSIDYVTIEGPADSQYSFAVQISLTRDDKYATGVNLKNCGNITHINAGSSAICMLSQRNPVIAFSSDRDDMGSYGVYQIEKN